MRAALLFTALLPLALGACEEDGAQSSGGSGGSAGLNIECLQSLPAPDETIKAKGRVGLTLDNFTYSFTEDRHRYSHNRRFKETGGVGVYIYRGRICVADGKDCADACVRYRVEPGGSLMQSDHHVATDKDPDRVTLEYWARDDAGNKMTFSKVLETSGKTARVTD